MSKTLYEVLFLESHSNLMRVSRIFETKRAAEKWGKWLATKQYTSLVQVWRGQGGILVGEWKR